MPDAQPSDGEVFREGDFCPEMVVLPTGTFRMGSHPDDDEAQDCERPRHRVSVKRFAIGQCPGDAQGLPVVPANDRGRPCLAEALPRWRPPSSRGGELAPCAGVPEVVGSRDGCTYRPPSEVAWEYAAFARRTVWHWRNCFAAMTVSCRCICGAVVIRCCVTKQRRMRCC